MATDLFAQMLAQYMAKQKQPQQSTGQAILAAAPAISSALGGISSMGGEADFAGTAGTIPGVDAQVPVVDAAQASNVQNFMGNQPPMGAMPQGQMAGTGAEQFYGNMAQQQPLDLTGGGLAAINSAPQTQDPNAFARLLAAFGG